MIQVSWTTMAAFLALIVMVGPGFYWIGRVSKQVDVNTENITVIYAKLDDIHDFVKNGRQPT